MVPLNDPNVAFVIINSNVKHNLSGSEYSTRRDDCFAAAKIMGKKSLREATQTDFESKFQSILRLDIHFYSFSQITMKK